MCTGMHVRTHTQICNSHVQACVHTCMCVYACTRAHTRAHTERNRKAKCVHWEPWPSKLKSACNLTKCHGEKETTGWPHVSAWLPEMKFCWTTEAFVFVYRHLECLWQDFNDSTSTAFWQASLAMDETHNSKSTVKSSLTSQDQTLHLNIFLGSGWGNLWTVI